MDKKTVYILKTNKDDQIISHGLHLERIISHIHTKQKNVKEISYSNLMTKEWAKNDFVFIVHSFSAWDNDTWQQIIDKIPNKISLVLTEFIEDKALLEKTFNHKKINKIIISVDSTTKYFNKFLSIENNKIKYVPLLGENFQQQENKNINHKNQPYPIIMVPSILSKDKNYESILNAIHRLKFKYPKVLAIFLIKLKHNIIDQELIDNLNDIINSLKIYDNVHLLVNPEDKYEQYLNYCDMVIIPSKGKKSLYYATIVDAIKKNKPIIAPDVTYASDLCKKEAGILLYEHNLENISEVAESIADNCSIISENEEIKFILSEQNKDIITYFDENKVLPQYVNVIRKLKNSNDISK